MAMSRIEKDYLGEIELPDEVYYGVQTARALENFQVSGITERPELIRAYILVKKAAALTNMELGLLDEKRGNAIIKAADEVLAGKFQDQFPVDVFQAGAGTSFNMNVNEVLANRALELLGHKKGEYDVLSPNDQVNMAQSTNDTFPTASHIAVIMAVDELQSVLSDLSGSFRKKGDEFGSIPKSGRTHLMDATPLYLGDEFSAYAKAVDRAAGRIKQRRDDLLELPIGGTAVGTGANAHPRFRDTVMAKLCELCTLDFIPPRDTFEALQSRVQLAALSGALRELALELTRIANDIRLLASGPTTGLAEIKLPAVQPGSSIMPGKINPVMAECLNMVAFQVIGNDTAVAYAAQAGQLDLNVMTPVMTHNILQSITILTNFLPAFTYRWVNCIEADEKRCRDYLELNPSMATLLTPKIGFLEAAKLAKEAYERRISVPKLAVEKGLITEKEAEEIFNPNKVAQSKYK
ncbi:MAG: aspartate ammonia-lyase [Thermoplasmata archaeon]|nr:MAG: aspartate ammonia-lyase [Thermoplasmata archaeon]